MFKINWEGRTTALRRRLMALHHQGGNDALNKFQKEKKKPHLEDLNIFQTEYGI